MLQDKNIYLQCYKLEIYLKSVVVERFFNVLETGGDTPCVTCVIIQKENTEKYIISSLYDKWCTDLCSEYMNSLR